MVYYSTDAAPLAGDSQGGLFKVYRQELHGEAAPEELFSFRGSAKNVEFARTNVAVSADGRYAVYSDERGLNLRDLQRGTETSLLANVDCSAAGSRPAGTPCFSYFDPMWSASGDWLAASKIFFEGAAPVTLQPFAPHAEEHDLGSDFQFEYSTWSETGNELCLLPGHSSGSAIVAAPDGAMLADLGEKLRAALHLEDTAKIFASWCGWGPDGEVAMLYASDNGAPLHVSVFDAAFRFQRDIEVTLPSSEVAPLASTQLSWLPDGSGFVVQHYSDPAADPDDSVLLQDGSVRSLSFAAGRVAGSIP